MSIELRNDKQDIMISKGAKWQGPAEVVSQINKVNYKVKMLDNPNGVDTYHVEKLKPFFGAV